MSEGEACIKVRGRRTRNHAVAAGCSLLLEWGVPLGRRRGQKLDRTVM